MNVPTTDPGGGPVSVTVHLPGSIPTTVPPVTTTTTVPVVATTSTTVPRGGGLPGVPPTTLPVDPGANAAGAGNGVPVTSTTTPPATTTLNAVPRSTGGSGNPAVPQATTTVGVPRATTTVGVPQVHNNLPYTGTNAAGGLASALLLAVAGALAVRWAQELGTNR